VFEKWSEPRTGAAAKRAEKVLDGLFQHPASVDFLRLHNAETVIHV
jgi:hypothetical protein